MNTACKAFVSVLCAAGLMGGSAVSAAQVTYRFSGYVGGSALTGAYSYDPTFYDGSYSDGGTLGQAYVNGAPVGSAHGWISINGGFSDVIGDAGSVDGVTYQTIVEKNRVLASGQVVDAFELYMSSTSLDGKSHDLALLTQQPASAPDGIFPGSPADDLSATQPVSFESPHAFTVGYYALGFPDGATFSFDFDVTSISSVPELPTGTLWVAGLALASLPRKRSRRTSAP